MKRHEPPSSPGSWSSHPQLASCSETVRHFTVQESRRHRKQRARSHTVNLESPLPASQDRSGVGLQHPEARPGPMGAFIGQSSVHPHCDPDGGCWSSCTEEQQHRDEVSKVRPTMLGGASHVWQVGLEHSPDMPRLKNRRGSPPAKPRAPTVHRAAKPSNRKLCVWLRHGLDLHAQTSPSRLWAGRSM